MPGRRPPPERDPAAAGGVVPELDPRRCREVREWLEGSRADAPSREELVEFVAWVSARIEEGLARRADVQALLDLLNAAREEVREA